MPASVAQILDLMEYANDGAAQAAFVTNATPSSYGPDVLTGGTPSDSGDYPGSSAGNACDGNDGTYWQGGIDTSNAWWKYDLGAGVTKVVRKLYLVFLNGYVGAFNLQGSNNNSAWTTITSGNADTSPKNFTFANAVAYRYYQLANMTGSSGGTPLIHTINMYEATAWPLQDYSEATIKQEGSYALKVIAAITDSLNKTLTRTVSPTINLSDKTIIKFDIRASRTGSNIKVGVHDSGGTTTEITPNILAANTWQTVVWDISAVSNANKDAIDSIIITILNADADNTFYIDNMFADIIPNYLIDRGRSRVRTAGVSSG